MLEHTVQVPRRNRVDPWGDLHAVPGRGLLTGNRGCLVNAGGTLVRHHTSSLWISCVTELRGRRQPLEASGRWTPIFFLDEAVALAAGHRPCAYCRRADYLSYRDAVARSLGCDRAPLASELNRRLAEERHRRGRGLVRAPDRLLWDATLPNLPRGTVVLGGGGGALLVVEAGVRSFSFDGWGPVVSAPPSEVSVLTPPTSVAALRNGYVPLLHPTAR